MPSMPRVSVRSMPVIAILSSAALALLLVFVPVFVSAQYVGSYPFSTSANCGVYSYSGASAYSYPYTNYSNTYPYTGCPQGNLLVYVRVVNPSVGITRSPSDFTVNVSGQNPSPASFAGSLSGTPVTVWGGYSVSAFPLPGFTATYSTGCSGDFSSNGQGLCMITENPDGYSYGNPVQPYPYAYTGINTLTCTPAYQTVNLGQQVTFFAQGGNAPYNWSTPNQTFLGTSASLTTTLQSAGTQTVVVSNSSQTATCTVNVVAGSGAVVYTAPNYTQITPANSVYTYTPQTTSYPAQTSITATYVPQLPNTGFEPLSVVLGQKGGASLALAIVLLSALGIVLFPYVRKISIASLR